jgi:hypothetical protein
VALKVPVVVEKPELAVVLGAVLLLLVLLAVAPVPPRAFRMDGPAEELIFALTVKPTLFEV